MEQTSRLGLPYILPSQAQKHVTHNEALDGLDGIVQLSVIDRHLAFPPAASAGDCYIVAADAGGTWAGKAGQIALYRDGQWCFIAPRTGWLAFVIDETSLFYWNGAAWETFGETAASMQNLERLGVGTTADEANPLAAKLNSVLWTARAVGEGGTGDLRYVLNKESGSNVLSLLFQSGYSGRAEIGLIGGEDMTVQVSADGASWTQALTVNRSTGKVTALGVAATADVQTFGASGAWTKPANARLVHVTCIGGGGGGGGGPKVAASTAASGGGGGGGGVRLTKLFPAGDLPAVVNVAVGAGGSGGAGATALAAGGQGGAGGSSFFGASLATAFLAAHGGGGAAGGAAGRASGGGGGGGRNDAGGSTTTASGGAAGTSGGVAGAANGGNGNAQATDFGGGSGGSSSATSGAAGAGGPAAAGAGGGAGGGFSTGNTAVGGGGVIPQFTMFASSGGAAPGGAGTEGTGGASSVSGNGGAGGVGTAPGQGGGGGGASQTGNGGNGGAGGPGSVIVVTYF